MVTFAPVNAAQSLRMLDESGQGIPLDVSICSLALSLHSVCVLCSCSSHTSWTTPPSCTYRLLSSLVAPRHATACLLVAIQQGS
eukprot:1028854-Amphidinium_carterae.1